MGESRQAGRLAPRLDEKGYASVRSNSVRSLLQYYSCIIAKTPENGFRKQRSIGDDASQGGHASRRRFSQKEGRDLWDLGRARASDSRFGPRRAVQHLVQQPSTAKSLEFRPMLTFERFTVRLPVLLSTFCRKPVGCSRLQGISRRTLLHALHV